MTMLDQLKTSLNNSVSLLFESASAAFPKIIFLFILLLVGWAIAKMIKFALTKALKAVSLQKVLDKMEMSPTLARAGITDAPKFIGKLGYWFIMLIVFIMAAENLEMEMISSGLAALIAYIPKLLSALIILLLGMFIANLIKKLVYTATDSIGLSGAQVISNIVYYVLFIFVFITAINQTGIDTSLITSNVTLLFAAILFAFAAAYGFAARDIMTNMLSSFYSKDKFQVGMKVNIKGVSGTILAIDNLSITIGTGDKKVMIPTKTLVSEQVEILE